MAASIMSGQRPCRPSWPSPAAAVRDLQGAGSHTPTFMTLQMQVLGAASCYSTYSSLPTFCPVRTTLTARRNPTLNTKCLTWATEAGASHKSSVCIVSCNLCGVIYPDCALIPAIGTFCPTQPAADKRVTLPGTL